MYNLGNMIIASFPVLVFYWALSSSHCQPTSIRERIAMGGGLVTTAERARDGTGEGKRNGGRERKRKECRVYHIAGSP